MKKYSSFIWAVAILVAAVIVINIGITWLSYESKEKTSPQEVVYNSSWDSSVNQVEDWMAENLNDPASIEYVEWSEVTKTPQGNFFVRCKYRANNKLGGKVLNNDVFFFNPQGYYIYHTAYQPD